MKRRQRRQRTETYKLKMSTYVRARRRYLKAMIVKELGGKCTKCGYDKCMASLAFHHRDPSQKEFDWSTTRKQTLATIRAEIQKCDLVCHNCHSELHFDAEAFNADVVWFQSIMLVECETTPCKGCGKQFQKRSRAMVYCNEQCKSEALAGKYPLDHEFIHLVETVGRSEIARQCGVSQRAVAKRYNKLIGASGGIRTRVPTL